MTWSPEATQARDVEDLVPDTIEVSSGQSFDGFWDPWQFQHLAVIPVSPPRATG